MLDSSYTDSGNIYCCYIRNSQILSGFHFGIEYEGITHISSHHTDADIILKVKKQLNNLSWICKSDSTAFNEITEFNVKCKHPCKCTINNNVLQKIRLVSAELVSPCYSSIDKYIEDLDNLFKVFPFIVTKTSGIHIHVNCPTINTLNKIFINWLDNQEKIMTKYPPHFTRRSYCKPIVLNQTIFRSNDLKPTSVFDLYPSLKTSFSSDFVFQGFNYESLRSYTNVLYGKFSALNLKPYYNNLKNVEFRFLNSTFNLDTIHSCLSDIYNLCKDCYE